MIKSRPTLSVNITRTVYIKITLSPAHRHESDERREILRLFSPFQLPGANTGCAGNEQVNLCSQVTDDSDIMMST